jgi:pyruvate/2-oxoglutarate dehydrogenase complex dihydrolipoamide acyltransferase (E2) component
MAMTNNWSIITATQTKQGDFDASDLSINSAARLNGELTYTLDKSFASAAGIGSLADINSEASSSEDPIDFCKDVPFIEDSTKYILKCALKDAISESGDITASVVGSNIVFRYKANLDATSDQTNFGSVSLTVRFIDPIVSIKENKVGLVKKVDNLTYRISGYATEPMDIEITANCSSRCGMINQVPAPVPSKTTSSTDAASAAVDAANKATDEANKAAADASAAKQKAIDDANAATDAALKAAEAADAKIAAEQAAKEKAAAEKAAEAKAAADKAAADKLAADVKAAAAKAAAELKAAAEKAAAELKAKQEAEAKALAEKAAADKAAAEKLLSDAKVAAAKILADAKAKATAVAKKITITCVKGKLIKKVIAVKPVCPPGYKKK